MNFSNYKFTLDMHTAQSQVSLPVVLNDTARKFYISLSDGGKSYHIADGCLALVRIKRPTGTYIEHFCSIEDNTNIVYDLSQFENTAVIPGVHDCEVTLYGLEDEVITTARFTMVVSNRVVYSDDAEIKDENWTMLDEIGNEEAKRQASESARNKAEKLRDEAEQGRAKAEFERETNTAIAIEAANAVAAELLRKAEDGEFNGKDGKDGKDGEDGYTPVKGVDYFDGKDGKNGDVGPVGPVGPAGVHVGTEAPTDGQTVWIDTDEEPEEEPEESGTKIDVIANVGQVIAVKAVGADSKPTEFEAIDLPKVTPPDFSANEGEEGYIKNRTHYIDEKGIVHKLSNKYIDADWMATSEDFIDPSIIIPEQKVTSTWSNRQMDIQPGIIYDVHINGVVYPCEALNKSGGIILGNNTAMTLNDYPFCIFWAGGTATGGMFFYNSTLESPIYMKVTGHSYTVYNKLPEEFLPEGVVKTVNGSKPDEKGNVSISAGGGGSIDVTAEVGQTIVVEEVDGNGKPTKWKAAEYQPRTHWTENATILPETVVEVDPDAGMGLIPVDFTVEGGEKYTVKYNGVDYAVECTAVEDGMFMGNIGSLGEGFEGLPVTNDPFALMYGAIGEDDEGNQIYGWVIVPLDGSASVSLSVFGEVATKIPTKYLDKKWVGNIASAAINGAMSEINEKQGKQGVEIENIKNRIEVANIEIGRYDNDPIDAGWITLNNHSASSALAACRYRAWLSLDCSINGSRKWHILKNCDFASHGSFSSTYFVHPIDTTESNNALAVRVIVYHDKIMYRIDTITL